MIRFALGFVLALLVLVPAFAHKYHTSLTELAYNAESQSFQLSIRIMAEDLERAISKGETNRLRLEDAGAEARVRVYLQQHIVVSAGGKNLPMTMLGMEPEVDIVWVYLTFPFKADSVSQAYAEAEMRNNIFFEFEPDQVNTVNIKRDGKVKSLVFLPAEPKFQGL